MTREPAADQFSGNKALPLLFMANVSVCSGFVLIGDVGGAHEEEFPFRDKWLQVTQQVASEALLPAARPVCCYALDDRRIAGKKLEGNHFHLSTEAFTQALSPGFWWIGLLTRCSRVWTPERTTVPSPVLG